MRAYGNCATGTGHATGPDLTMPVPAVPPPRAPVRTYVEYAHLRAEDDRRRKASTEARAALAAVGRRWRDAREWALSSGGFSRADCPPNTINPLVASAYLTHLEKEAS